MYLPDGETIFMVVIGGVIYFAPTIVGRGQDNMAQIFILNLLLGWTLIGWIIALVWAFKPEKKAIDPAPVKREASRPATLTDQLESLSKMRAQGVITDEEFAQAKARIFVDVKS